MKRKIKLAAIYSGYAEFKEEANSYSKSFDRAAAEKYIESNIENLINFLHDAGRKKADLVVTPEDFKGFEPYIRNLEKTEIVTSLAETIPGPTSERFGEIAQKYNMYISANYYEKDGDKLYNTSILLGRDGEIIGKYRKVHLPASEKWMISSGKDMPVFDTDIGKIGFATCYDIEFPEHCRIVALNGADIILHSTAGWGFTVGNAGEALVRTRAAENSVYMVVAKCVPFGNGGKSCIIDNCGNILCERSGNDEGIVTAEIVPDFDILNGDPFDAFWSGVDSVRARLALEREPSLYASISAKNPPLIGRYAGIELKTTKDQVEEVARQFKEHMEAILDRKREMI